MSTTSLELSDELKQRTAFVAEALAARAEMLQTGLGQDAELVGAYLRARITDKQAPRPDAKPWGK